MAAKRSTSKAKAKRSRSTSAPKKRKVAKKVAKKTAKKKTSKKAPAKKSSTKRKSSAKTKSATLSRDAEAQVAQIQRVIDVMVAAGAVEVEMEGAGTKFRVRLKDDQPIAVSAAPTIAPAAVAVPIEAAPAASPEAAAPAAPAPAAVGEVFKSPMVGTFYTSPSPDAEPFAKAGDVINPDSVICIIEAMKVMNEIKAEMSGEIVEVLAENGEPVDYGQPLFTIKT